MFWGWSDNIGVKRLDLNMVHLNLNPSTAYGSPSIGLNFGQSQERALSRVGSEPHAQLGMAQIHKTSKQTNEDTPIKFYVSNTQRTIKT